MINKRLKEIRIEKGFSQTELAEALGTTQGAIGKYERGELDLNTEKITQICKILNVSPNDLFGWDSPENQK